MYIAERNDDPTFGNAFLTFSSCPQLQRVPTGNILEKISVLQKADWGYNTNLQAVFDVILETAKTRILETTIFLRNFILLVIWNLIVRGK